MPTSRPSLWQSRGLEISCIAIVFGMLFATLYPFDILPPNRVSWLPDANGVRLAKAGVILSPAPVLPSTSSVASPSAGRPVTFEIVLSAPSIHLLRNILTVYRPTNPEQFVIRQWASSLVISRDERLPNSEFKRTRVQVGGMFDHGRTSVLIITSGPNGAIVYVNGEPNPFPHLSLSPDDVGGQIIIGISSQYFDWWSGEVHGLAIYNRELTPDQVQEHTKRWLETPKGQNHADAADALAIYPFNEGSGGEIHNAVATGTSIHIPATFRIPHKGFLRTPREEFAKNWEYVDDVLRNIVGFMPLGFLLCAWLQRKRSLASAIVFATVLGGLLSLTVEILQYWVPPRSSGFTDVITNTTGALLGALLARPFLLALIFRHVRISNP
jgi:VanZ like family/Concanavalin A-like lectin/glucanases superfamily